MDNLTAQLKPEREIFDMYTINAPFFPALLFVVCYSASRVQLQQLSAGRFSAREFTANDTPIHSLTTIPMGRLIQTYIFTTMRASLCS